MKNLIAVLALVTLIAAPAFSQSAAAARNSGRDDTVGAARKMGRDSCQSLQNENCYWRGYPLWQWYSS